MKKSKLEIEYEQFQIDRLNNHITLMQIEYSSKKSSAKLLHQYLIDNRIRFISEKTFDDFKGHRFDFYLYDFNLIIEYDGEQHFKPIKHFGGQIGFNERRIKDIEKDEYCKKNNINLIRINCHMNICDMTSYLINCLKLIVNDKVQLNHSIKIEYNHDFQLKDIIINNNGDDNQNISDINNNISTIDIEIINSYYGNEYKDIIYLIEDYEDYLKYYKAYYYENSNLKFLEFKNYIINHFKESYTLSKKPIKYNNKYTFILTRNNQTKIQYKLDEHDIIQQFANHLKSKNILSYSHLACNTLFNYYKDWLYKNYPKNESTSAKKFNKELIKKLEQQGFIVAHDTKTNKDLVTKPTYLKSYEINNYLFYDQVDDMSSELCNVTKSYSISTTSRYLINSLNIKDSYQFNIIVNAIINNNLTLDLFKNDYRLFIDAINYIMTKKPDSILASKIMKLTNESNIDQAVYNIMHHPIDQYKMLVENYLNL